MVLRLVRSCVFTLLSLVLLGGLASGVGAQEPPSRLELSWGDNRPLVFTGNDWRPNERVTITARIDGQSYNFTTRADAQGSFRVETNVMVPPGAGVQYQAEGDQGTGVAGIADPPPVQQARRVTATVATDRPSYSVGETVRFTLTVRNNSSAPVTVTLPTGQRYDFVVRSSGGGEVWRWSRDRAFTQIFGEQTLAPGQTLTFSDTWDQRDNAGRQAPAGTYTVVGIFTSAPPLESAPASFTIGQVPPPSGETVQLFAACNNVSLTWPDATPTGAVARAVSPGSALIAIWRYNNATQTFQGFSPQFPEASNLATVNRLDAVFICMNGPGSLTRPVLP